jgi:hypothetical protein
VVQLISAGGQGLWKMTTPRPLRHLTFVPERPVVLGCADFGLVVCLDAAGQVRWRDGLVATVGSLAVSGDGAAAVLACYSDGLYVCGPDGPPARQSCLPGGTAARAALSYAGDKLLVAGIDHRLWLAAMDGTVLGQLAADGPVVGVGLAPLADYAVVALGEGRVLGLTPHPPLG